MTDHEAMTDEESCRRTQAQEREYTVGWRAYRDGKPCPRTFRAKAGWIDAQHAVEQLGRRIDWSAKVADGDWVVDEPVSWQRANTDRDRAPAHDVTVDCLPLGAEVAGER